VIRALAPLVALAALAGCAAASGPAPTGVPAPVPVAAAAAAAAGGAAIPAIDSLFAAWDRPGSPGCALAVLQDGAVRYARGYGRANLDYDVPLTPRTAFYLASVSKQFTAAAVALAAEQGYLSLDDDVRRWFPELPDYGRTITVRHLVHHTSGLRDYLTLMQLAGMPFGNVWAPAEIVDLVARQRQLNFPPGDEFLYSNSGYFLMAQLVGRATGRSLRQFTTEEIFRPLGMHGTWFHDDAWIVVPERAVAYAPDRAAGGAGDDGTRRAGDHAPAGFRMTHLFQFDGVGSGGLYSTLQDLAIWDANLYANRIGGPDFLPTLHTRGILTTGDTLPYAFGLIHGEYRGLRTVEHGGSMMGFRTGFLRFPDQRTSVIALCNLATIDPAALGRRVADAVLGERMGPPPERRPGGAAPAAAAAAAAAAPAPLAAAALAAYAGRFTSDELRASYDVALRGDSLVVRRRGDPDTALVSAGDDVFRLAAATLRFVRGASGAVEAFELDAGRVRNIRFVRENGAR
jgi:CubicO group peptidase (beta-lactamase class C family)